MKKRTMILSAAILCILLVGVVACAKQRNSVDTSLYERDATENDRVYFNSHAVYDGTYRNQLTEDEKVFYDAYVQHFLVERSLEPFEFNVRDMGFLATETDQLNYISAIAGYAFSNDHPEAYWVDYPYAGFDFDENGQYIIKAVVTPQEKYNGAYNDWDTVQSGIETVVNEIRALRNSESRYDTIKAIHDYICDNLSFHNNYEEEYAGEQQCASPLFGGGSIGKENVCEGYSMTFKLLCDHFDIPAAVIGSRSHAFNYVQMDDGCYYAVDCLWDDQNPTRYDYFLIGYNTILWSYDKQNDWRFSKEYDHIEYWYYFADGMDHTPFVYPAVSDYAYSRIELLGEAADPKTNISGTATFQFRYQGNDFTGQKANVYFDDKLIGTSDIDENGLFEVTYDTTQLYNGYNKLSAVVGDQTYTNYIMVQNPQFEILDWKDEVITITEAYEVKVKGYCSGEITKCKINVWLDGSSDSQRPFAVSEFNSEGVASFVIDPKKCGDGLHQIMVVYHKPGSNAMNNLFYQRDFRSFRVSNSAADSGKLRFWGTSANSDRYVGEWADFTLKYDGKVTENCQFNVTIDDSPATPLRQGDDKITDFFDKDGFCTFYLDVNGQSNGKHKIQATLTKEDGSTVTASNTVNVTDGYCQFELWKYNDNGDLVLYSDRNTAINGFVRMRVENISGQPASRCRVWVYEDDMLQYDYNIKKNLYNQLGDDNCFILEVSSPDVNFGKHILKCVFMTPDGTVVEKNLPCHLEPKARFYDDLHFSVNNRSEIRKVGKTVDFTLNYLTCVPDECKSLSITLDGKPTDIQMDDAASSFDHFGRFFFTLAFTDAQQGEHIIEAVLTKKDGAVMTAKQKVFVTNDYFELTNWKDAEPVLHRVTEVKVKNLSEDLTIASTVRQYIDGEDMGVVSFDENGLATLGLNTAGLEKGAHWYKVVFTNANGEIVERLMGFRVE